MIDEELLAAANFRAIASLGHDTAPLTRIQAVAIVVDATGDEASRLAGLGLNEHVLRQRLTLAGIAAVRQAQAGLMPRAEIIASINLLSDDHKMVFGLRYEHGLSDAEIAEVMSISEDEVVTLMLKALMIVTGAKHGTD